MFDITQIPLSLYIHMPWCVKKCPYCDFNSHALRDQIPEQKYIKALIQDLQTKLEYTQDREIHSIFIGGGTPSLFSGESYDLLFSEIQKRVVLKDDIEITMEANPGTVEQQRFNRYREAGINRLSLGVQSFQDEKLQRLGRIHGREQAISAIEATRKAGFENFNLDLMHGLPNQTMQEALDDLQQAIQLKPTHLSWYQLTLEPNTYFYKYPPNLPNDDAIFEIQQQGKQLLHKNGYQQYEVSAYAQHNQQCQHNLNYWQFGDYIGIGAGAHGKISHQETQNVSRHSNYKHPKNYLDTTKSYIENTNIITQQALAFEFMLNALRLQRSIPISLFQQRTGISINTIQASLNNAQSKQFLTVNKNSFELTDLGRRFLNDVLEVFLPNIT